VRWAEHVVVFEVRCAVAVAVESDAAVDGVRETAEYAVVVVGTAEERRGFECGAEG
jgi:hypothetical protein